MEDEEDVLEKSELQSFEQLEQLTTQIEKLEERCELLENKLKAAPQSPEGGKAQSSQFTR